MKSVLARPGYRPLPLAVAIAIALAGCAPAPTSAPTAAPPTGTPAPSPTLAATATPAPVGTASPTPVETGPTAVSCSAADLKVSHGLVEGTAGSRYTEVVLVTAIPCALPAWPTFGLRDARGGALVAGTPDGSGFVTLSPNAVYASEARLANWCGPEPAFPLTLELRVGGELVPVTGGSFPDEGDMPPCAAGATPMLTGTAWAPTS